MAGFCYLAAVVWYEIFCPLLLKQVLAPKVNEQGPHWRRWGRALVEDELRRWWCKREWTPPLELLDASRSTDRSAIAIMASYGTPAFAGFGVRACAHIELALQEFATTQKICMWQAPERHGDKLSEFEPGYGYEGNRPWVRRLHIRRPEQIEMAENPGASEMDLVIQWYRSEIIVSHMEPHEGSLNIEYDAEGLQHLFDTDEHAAAFTMIVAHWQDSLHPWRRLLLLILYALSIASFSWFALKQIISAF